MIKLKNSLKLTYCGVITAISVVIMFFTSLIPIGLYVLPAIAGYIITSVKKEINFKWAFLTYIAVSIVSLMLVAEKESVLMFIFFFGYYPILKFKIDEYKSKVIKIILKFLCFNISVIFVYFIAIQVLNISENEFEILGVYIPGIFLFLGNIIFFAYDYSLVGAGFYYDKKIHPYINKLSK